MVGPSRSRMGALAGLIGLTGLIGVSLVTAACGGSSTAKGGGSTSHAMPTATATQAVAPTPTAPSAPPTATPKSTGPSCPTAAQETPTFQVIANASNISGDSLVLDNCALNGHPNAPIFVTANWSIGNRIYDTSPIGVWYNTDNNRWEIYNETAATMAAGVGFNVLIAINPHSASGSTYSEQASIVTATTATGDNTPLPGYTDPNELVFAVQNWGVNHNRTYINAPLGVYYYLGDWRVFREDRAAMPVGVTFNVFGITQTPTAFFHQAISGQNITGDYTAVNESPSGSLPANFPGANSNALAFEMPNWSYNGNETTDAVPTGVWYNGSDWAIFNQDNSSMANNMSFNILFLNS